MAELFKNVFNPTSLKRLSEALAMQYQEFDEAGFYAAVTCDLDSLELKQRSDQIITALHTFLPEDFPRAAAILVAALAPETADTEDWSMGNTEQHKKGVSGWLVMPMTEFIGRYGQQHFACSMDALHAMTQRFSAEFGIRHFLKAMPAQTLQRLQEWTSDPSVHVRRLASEGSRPTLPWGIGLPDFLADPSHTAPILNALKDDPEEFVRRSVANHLNDLSKKHPQWVTEIAAQWLQNASAERQKLVKHACRTLFKQGNPDVLALFGFASPAIYSSELMVDTPIVEFGDELRFSLNICASSTQTWMVDYVVHHKKANGSLAPKVFKWKTLTVKSGETVSWEKKHAIKPITTRKYYDGEHRLSVVINGQIIGTKTFQLQGVISQ